MAGQDRALHVAWNVGIETVTPTSRVIHSTWNLGVEIVAVASRSIHAAWNVGIENLSVTSRALHAAWNVVITKQVTDPAEWLLYNQDLQTIEFIIRGMK